MNQFNPVSHVFLTSGGRDRRSLWTLLDRSCFWSLSYIVGTCLNTHSCN